jgi:hypothetical protein
MGTKHVTRDDVVVATGELRCQTGVNRLREQTPAAGDSEPGLLASQPSAADGDVPPQGRQRIDPARSSTCTEDALRRVATALDRVATAYLASLQKRTSGSR